MLLTRGEVEVWCILLDQMQPDLERYSGLLSPDEKSRSERFYFQTDREHYIICHGALRTLVGRYLQAEPSEIEFEYEPNGKPVVRKTFQEKTLHFNLSHSRNAALIAFSWTYRVGIDIEHIREMADEDRFAEMYFSARECDLIRSLAGRQKLEAFFKIWTCKEAFLKARGEGLTKSINRIEVSLEDGKPAQLVSVYGDRDQAREWRLDTFNPIPNYQACLAVARNDWQSKGDWQN
jgi:4'-phosphopantetheinyl transferase